MTASLYLDSSAFLTLIVFYKHVKLDD